MLDQIINDRQVIGRTFYVTLPDENIKESMGDTIIDVNNTNFIAFVNTIPTTITNFLGGINGRVILILGDNQTSIDNNSNIHTNTGAIKLLNKLLYIFVYYKGIWYERN